jgi:hypothetical protein
MGDETDRTVVKTYVPRNQKDEWKDHADQLGMTQSEFVRSMVQAGRRGFDDATESLDESGRSSQQTQGGSPGENPRGSGLEERVLDVLRDGVHSWDDLVDAVVGELESELDQTLQELQTAGKIRYSGRADGYELVEA